MTLTAPPERSSPFSQLPVEIYENVVRYMESADSLTCLSRTCKHLSSFADLAGWRVFAQSRFPSLASTPLSPAGSHKPGYWKTVARLLISQSRSWDRRALLATTVDPYSRYNTQLQKCLDDNTLVGSMSSMTIRPHVPSVQSAGFHPVLDCGLELGDDMSSKREVLAIGAGADLFIRVRSSGKFTRHGDWIAAMDQHGQQITWYTAGATAGGLKQGRDDITSVNLIDVHTLSAEAAYVDVIVGRANGLLQRLSISRIQPQVLCVANFVAATTEGSVISQSFQEPIVSADLDNSQSLLAVISKKAVSLYDTRIDSQDILPVSKVQIDSGTPSYQNFSTKFLSPQRLAVTGRSSSTAIRVFEVAESGLESTPTHALGSSGDDYESSINTESVFAIEPLSPSIKAGGSRQGDMFISGWYDGSCRLFDLRTPSGVVSTYRDPLDHDSAIYSLVTFGQERFVAGGARHSLLKIFDFRIPGAKCYSYSSASQSLGNDSATNSHQYLTSQSLPNWNVYLGVGKNRGRRTENDSPVFSLKSVSPYSPVLYAGTSNSIFELNAISSSDSHFEPYYGDQVVSVYPPQENSHIVSQGGLRRKKSKHVSHQKISRTVKKWDPVGDVLGLKMVETDDGTSPPGSGRSMVPTLRAQGRVGGRCVENQDVHVELQERLDERWFAV